MEAEDGTKGKKNFCPILITLLKDGGGSAHGLEFYKKPPFVQLLFNGFRQF